MRNRRSRTHELTRLRRFEGLADLDVIEVGQRVEGREAGGAGVEAIVDRTGDDVLVLVAVELAHEILTDRPEHQGARVTRDEVGRAGVGVLAGDQGGLLRPADASDGVG